MKSNNQWLVKSIITTSLAITLSLGASLPSVASDKVIATVNGENINESTFNSLMDVLKRSNRNGDINKNAVLENMIETHLVLQEAIKSGIAEREDIQQKFEEYKERLLLQAWADEKTQSFNISDDEVKKAYDDYIVTLPKQEYKARHILVKTEDEAKALITELEGGKDFAELAKEKSTGPSGPKGGDLGWFPAKTMVAPFAEAVKTMEKDSISKPVKTKFGFHVIKLEDKRDVKIPELKPLESRLKRSIEQEKMTAFIADLRKNADVKIMLEQNDEKKEEQTTESTEAEKK
jgi:peptidyl-prolyl cis-trans isomerase C